MQMPWPFSHEHMGEGIIRQTQMPWPFSHEYMGEGTIRQMQMPWPLSHEYMGERTNYKMQSPAPPIVDPATLAAPLAGRGSKEMTLAGLLWKLFAIQV